MFLFSFISFSERLSEYVHNIMNYSQLWCIATTQEEIILIRVNDNLRYSETGYSLTWHDLREIHLITCTCAYNAVVDEKLIIYDPAFAYYSRVITWLWTKFKLYPYSMQLYLKCISYLSLIIPSKPSICIFKPIHESFNLQKRCVSRVTI